MLALNQIKKILVDYFNSHAQINSVVYGDSYKYAADRNINYPVANIEWIESNVSGKQLNHTYKIILADKINRNVENIEDEIQSDMLLITDDFMSFLQDSNDFSFLKSSQIVKFTDDNPDRTTGVRFRIILSTIRRQNDCVTPNK